MSYYVKVKGLKSNGRVHVIYREKRVDADEKADYYRRHGFAVVVGTVRNDGQLSQPRKVQSGATT